MHETKRACIFRYVRQMNMCAHKVDICYFICTQKRRNEQKNKKENFHCKSPLHGSVREFITILEMKVHEQTAPLSKIPLVDWLNWRSKPMLYVVGHC